MAYSTLIASVPLDSVTAYRDDASASLDASMVIHVSHALAYWVQLQPLGHILGEIIDGGEELAARLWHPFRSPILHAPVDVGRLANELQIVWGQALEKQDALEHDDFFQPQITKLLALLQHAAKQGEAVVSFLDKPADHARARKVEIPELRVTQ